MSETKSMPAEEEIYYLSEFYKVFGDSTRIKILYLLVDGNYVSMILRQSLL